MARDASWRRFLHPYYLCNLLLTAPTYLLVRAWWLEHGDPRYSRMEEHSLAERERIGGMALAISLGTKFWKRTSDDAFLSDALFWGKTATGLMIWFMDWRLAALFALAAVVVYLLFPQPLFRGPSAVEELNPASFQAQVEDSTQPDVAWLVEFYAPWSPPCVHLEPVVAELSLKYACERLKWGKVDASRWPQLAEAHKVPVYGAIPALPMFILFEKGKELGRIPHLYEDGSVSTIKIDRRSIVTAFGLDEYLEEPKRRPGGGGGKGGSTKKRR